MLDLRGDVFQSMNYSCEKNTLPSRMAETAAQWIMPISRGAGVGNRFSSAISVYHALGTKRRANLVRSFFSLEKGAFAPAAFTGKSRSD